MSACFSSSACESTCCHMLKVFRICLAVKREALRKPAMVLPDETSFILENHLFFFTFCKLLLFG